MTFALRRRLSPFTADLPTLGVATLVYGGWVGVTALHELLPPCLIAVLGGWLIAWHGSLQHETIHGRPTGVRALDTLVGAWPLSLWLPYARYRETHLAHHRTDHVTHPDYDPETRYLSGPLSGLRGRLRQRAAGLQSTLVGRLLLGPFLEIGGFLATEAARLVRGGRATWTAWLQHALGVAAVLAWLHACRLDLGLYLLCFVLPGTALTLLRSFAEHRADPDPRRRAAVVERAPLLGLLFLNNNLHAAHHAWPDLAWWRLPAAYARERQSLLQANGGLVYRGYGEVAARFWRRAHDVLVHPEAASTGARRP